MKRFKIVRSVKQAAVCRYHGLDVDLVYDCAHPGKVVFKISPPSAAEKTIEVFEAGELLPARELLDTAAGLHQEVKHFLYLHKQISGQH